MIDCSCKLSVIFVALVANYATAEWFSSLGQMEDLIHDESDLISSLREYISAEEAKLENIKRRADQYQRISESAKSNIDNYLGHPVNQYRLVKRLALEWSDVENLVKHDTTPVFLNSFSDKRSHFPNEDDMIGSAQAIMRLQDTYKLDTHAIAQGFIKGSHANETLTAEDCYFIGRTAYTESDYYHCVLWMNEVSRMSEDVYLSFSRFDVLDHLSYCLAEQGNVEKAYELALEMLEIDPNHNRIKGNAEHYRNSMKTKKKGDDGVVESSDGLTRMDDYPSIRERNHYEALCRNTRNIYSKKVERKLKCYLWTNHKHPRLLLQPVKLEELWHSPHLVRFYDVVTDDEINVIKTIAKPVLNRATVHNPLTGNLEHAHYRVSKSAWFTDDQHPVVKKVCQRISDITGLSMSTAEELQVANYGVGGQYEPHYDFATESDAGKFDDEEGNRIATFLIYLTDIGYGGRTVFLHPGIGVKPIKGSAAFWYNLFPSGDGDLRTKHAACPVLTGVKWVSNKWLHERDQEFRRKCSTRRSADNRIF